MRILRRKSNRRSRHHTRIQTNTPPTPPRLTKSERRWRAETQTPPKVKRALQAKIDGLQERIGSEQQKLLLLQTVGQQQKRIDELEAEEKKLNEEYERLTQGLYLCEEFIKTKVAMLGKNINEKFSSVQFRLFKTQINGGIQEDCEVMIPTPNGLVPYSTANNAARINAGLEIIDTLAQHWGITMPVFVDNAESVVKLKKIGSQVIRLVVPAAWEELSAEVREALTGIHGSEDAARLAYEEPNKTLRTEVE